MAYIVAADDDSLLVDVVSFKPEAAGHRVLAVANGQAAIAAERPDLVILDAVMPFVSRRQVLQKLRTEAATASLPIIMLSARKGQEDVVAALQQGANEHVTKPSDLPLLLGRVDARLNGGRRWRYVNRSACPGRVQKA